MHKGLFSCEELAGMLAAEFVLADGTPATVEDLRRSLESADFIGYRPRLWEESNFSVYEKNVSGGYSGISTRKFPAFLDLHYSDVKHNAIKIFRPSPIISLNSSGNLKDFDLDLFLSFNRSGTFKYEVRLVKAVAADFKEFPYGIQVFAWCEARKVMYVQGEICHILKVSNQQERIKILMKLNADFDGEWEE